ncbi:hypothetical protein EHW99_3585 [Erwinia amylovora]|uniref:Uncharacterized protein n=3 Tax=Erwinia amylovora TaxID=552 RepID=A0A830ZYY0_ERWAM|nr:hypothetical protein EaACW_3661 [Erwinia amylovora ACW56400]QJQ56284.1 hypothetical protein EHX00_3585 [Erwinia amylovora]CBA24048.1 hypothetical protein predicted by Glimmer/Critica [Erwinia amylovora CFBP1430]CBX82519.1 hypothetical protein predicted by Glimmer/Critica [Erwinia amylovora ATCC BAA-2158]CCO80493.1 hypothetical protein BN432_3726 [Erwinia amylovora Ea356]CCO84303.1 hypothetical protein BN433_3759 [Erwinia amylovora Ea266]CCO88059.1 hypothetical protein BN434_3701 [Erwinia a
MTLIRHYTLFLKLPENPGSDAGLKVCLKRI